MIRKAQLFEFYFVFIKDIYLDIIMQDLQYFALLIIFDEILYKYICKFLPIAFVRIILDTVFEKKYSPIAVLLYLDFCYRNLYPKNLWHINYFEEILDIVEPHKRRKIISIF